MMLRRKTWMPAALLVTTVLSMTPARGAERQEATEQVIIQVDPGARDSLSQLIESLGGRITRDYQYLGAVAAEVPQNGLDQIRALVGEGSIMKDDPVPAPEMVFPFGGRGDDSRPTSHGNPLTNIHHDGAAPIGDVAAFASDHPGAYRMNHSSDNVRALHADGWTGDGVVVAVLDTGLRPGFGHFDATVGGPTVVGCDDFIPDPAGCLDPGNDGHGTMVAGAIAGAATYAFDASSVFLNSVAIHASGAALDLDATPGPESVAVIGSAPGARIYALRVFLDSFTPTPSSVILSAVNHVIHLKTQVGINIQVANLSLGRYTLYAGKGAFDIAHDALLAAGIVPVASAGNAGPALLTAASPASAYSTVAVGAGSQAHQERIAADVGFFGFPGLGQFLRPFPLAQTATFSSRGPHADGRIAPNVMSDGFGVYGAGLGLDPGTVSLGNGTSFAAPNVSGIAALLREAFPNVSAAAIHNAIVESGNPGVIDDGSTELDQGNGWVDASQAFMLLQENAVSGSLPPPPQTTPLVSQNIRRGTDLRTRSGNVTETVSDILPGGRVDVLYEVLPSYQQIEIAISDVLVQPGLCAPNLVFGDEVQLALHTAKTSKLGPAGDYYDINPHPGFTLAFISPSDPFNPNASGVIPGACGNGECRFTLVDPEPGVSRISVSGATTNRCSMSARVEISPERGSEPRSSRGGPISDDGSVGLTFEVPSGVSALAFQLEWQNDWSRYPTNDVDLLVFLPGFPFPLPFAQTLDAPENFVLTPELLGQLFGSPTPIPIPPGTWEADIVGFEVNERSDRWNLHVSADGKVLRVKKGQ